MEPPPRPSSRPPSPSIPPDTDLDTSLPQPTLKPRLSIKTHHCRFCSHLLLATTRDLDSLPRRREPAVDRAIILPLPREEDEGESEDDDEDEYEDEDGDGEGEEGEEGEGRVATNKPAPPPQKQPKAQASKEDEAQSQSQATQTQQKHYTILLSTTLPDRRHTMIRREDGFEKRLLLRCGRCRVVVGYVLDEETHWRVKPGAQKSGGDGDGDGEDEDGDGEKAGEGRAKVVYLLPGALVGTEDMGVDVKIEREEWRKWVKG